MLQNGRRTEKKPFLIKVTKVQNLSNSSFTAIKEAKQQILTFNKQEPENDSSDETINWLSE